MQESMKRGHRMCGKYSIQYERGSMSTGEWEKKRDRKIRGNVFICAAPRKPISFRAQWDVLYYIRAHHVVPVVRFNFSSDQNLQGTDAIERLTENLIKKARIFLFFFSFFSPPSNPKSYFTNILYTMHEWHIYNIYTHKPRITYTVTLQRFIIRAQNPTTD